MARKNEMSAAHSPTGAPPTAGHAARNRQLFSLFAGGITGIARRFALGLECGFPRCGLFLFARELGCGSCGRLFFVALLLGLGGIARQLGFGAFGGLRFALGLALFHRGIVGARLAAKLVQNILLRLLCRLLPVREAGFLESAH